MVGFHTMGECSDTNLTLKYHKLPGDDLCGLRLKEVFTSRCSAVAVEFRAEGIFATGFFLGEFVSRERK